MNKDAFTIKKFVEETCCSKCDVDIYSECKEGNVDCYTKKILSLLSNFNDSNEVVEENSTGCEICRTKNGKPRSLFVMTDANQTITDIKFCPVCGARM